MSHRNNDLDPVLPGFRIDEAPLILALRCFFKQHLRILNCFAA